MDGPEKLKVDDDYCKRYLNALKQYQSGLSFSYQKDLLSSTINISSAFTEALSILKQIEWASSDQDGEHCCPCCGSPESDPMGHDKSCGLNNFLERWGR